MRALASLSLAALAGAAFSLPGLTGTWVNAKPMRQKAVQPEVRIVFLPGNRFTVQSASVKGEGTYTLKGLAGKVVMTKRNGVRPINPHEREGRFTISRDGRELTLFNGNLPLVMKRIR